MDKIDTFIDGAAVGRPGVHSFVSDWIYIGSSAVAQIRNHFGTRRAWLSDDIVALQYAGYRTGASRSPFSVSLVIYQGQDCGKDCCLRLERLKQRHFSAAWD